LTFVILPKSAFAFYMPNREIRWVRSTNGLLVHAFGRLAAAHIIKAV